MLDVQSEASQVLEDDEYDDEEEGEEDNEDMMIAEADNMDKDIKVKKYDDKPR